MLIIVALSIIVLLSFAALAIDFSYLMFARQRAQNAVDASAHAAMVAYTRTEGDDAFVRQVGEAMMERHGYDDVLVELGAYDFDTRAFSSGGARNNAIRVMLEGEEILEGDLFIAPRLDLPLSTRGGDIESVSAIQPREIYFVLDQSCSMSSGAKVASMTLGVVKALEAVEETDPNGQDEVALIGFGDDSVLHTPLTNVADELASLRSEWSEGICLCSLDPYVQYFAAIRGASNPESAEAYITTSGAVSYDEASLHPLGTGDAHYGTEGNAELNFRCCEPHCDTALEASRPAYPSSQFFDWLATYSHGNGVLWGLQEARAEIEASSRGGSHRVVIVLGDGIDFCPSGANRAAMPEPCASGGDLLTETIDYAAELNADRAVNLYPVYYGNNSTARDYYADLVQGQGELFNPTTPEELEELFAEIVWRSQVVLVPTGSVPTGTR